MFDVETSSNTKEYQSQTNAPKEEAPVSIDQPEQPAAAVNAPLSHLPRSLPAPSSEDANQVMPKRDISTFNNYASAKHENF